MSEAMTKTATELADQYTDEGLATREQDQGQAAPLVATPAYISYVWRKSTSSEVKASLRASGVDPDQSGVFALTRAGFITPLSPFKFHLFDFTNIWTENDDEGKVISGQWEEPTTKADGSNWGNHTYAIVAAVVGDTLVPASINLRRGAAKALKNATVALGDCRKLATWKAKGPQYAATAACLYPSGRFVAVGSCRAEKSPKTNRPMLTGFSTCAAATADEMSRLTAAMADPQFLLDLAAVRRVHAYKLKDVLGGGVQEAEVVGGDE